MKLQNPKAKIGLLSFAKAFEGNLGDLKVSRYEFLKKILTQLEALQTTLNTLRDTVKEEIISNSSTAEEGESK